MSRALVVTAPDSALALLVIITRDELPERGPDEQLPLPSPYTMRNKS
jgi:hypothetical protein